MQSLKSSRTKALPSEVTELFSSRLKDAAPEDIEGLRLTLKEEAKSNLWFFAYYCCGFQDTDVPLHHEMCHRWMQRKHRKFSIWLIPRSHLKTSLWTVAGSLWEIVNNPDIRILIVNAKLENAVNIMADIRIISETNEVFNWLFPEFNIRNHPLEVRKRCKWGVERLDFPCSKRAGRKEGNIESMSVGASLVSKHYDLMIFDDPVNDENTTTKEYRDKIHTWYKNALQLRDNPTTSRVRLIGTRWHFDDLYDRLISQEKKRRKAQVEKGEKVTPRYLIYRRKAIEDGIPIWPERFYLEELDRLKEELGSYIYSCQYDNDPLPEEDAHFKRSDIKVVDEFDIPDNLINFIAVDMADEETTKGDFTVVTVASFDEHARMYIREIHRGKYSMNELLELIWKTCVKWRPMRVGIETTGFQKAIVRSYRRLSQEKGWKIPWKDLERGKSTKFKRTLGLQPRVERGEFYIEEGTVNMEWLIEEMTTFPLGRHDDILDTVVDLENLYFAAPHMEEEEETKETTFEQYFGTMFEEESENQPDSCYVGS